MPIYEFYCPKCHTIFSFLSRRVDTERVPSCPKCQRKKLERQVSRFAFSSRRSEPSGEGDPSAEMDDPRMEQAMMQLASEFEHADENDPRAMARMMRKMMDTTGMPMNEGMEEAIRRMEAGEDPDRIEEELGDVFDDADPSASPAGPELPLGPGGKIRRRLLAEPNVDPTLYDM